MSQPRFMRAFVTAVFKALNWLNPIAWAMELRRSLTAASVSLVLIGIVSLNIVWGYPWLGMFAACGAMFLVGRLLNFLSLPELKPIMNLPGHVAVGEDIGVPIRLINVGRWPGMDLSFEKQSPCRFLAPGAEAPIQQTLRFHQRGPRRLPPILVESYFPFYLFRGRKWIQPPTTIVATPRRLRTDSDEHWRTLEATLKGIASRAAQGDQVHYIGNREYREGVPVRRWDFSSWARLGKPVLREFSSPSSKTINIVIDNFRPEGRSMAGDRPGKLHRAGQRLWTRLWGRTHSWHAEASIDEPFERILSLAASSIEILSRNGSAITLEFAYGEPEGGAQRRTVQEYGVETKTAARQKYRCEAGGDPSALLIALGKVRACSISEQTSPIQDDSSYASDRAATVVLSCRDADEIQRLQQAHEMSPNTLWVTDATIESIPGSDAESSPLELRQIS